MDRLGTLATEYAPVAALKPHPDNPRRGQVDVIKGSLATNGQYRPLVVSRATGHVLAGNHTLRAAIELGWTEVAVTYLDDLTPEAERRILLADNRTADLGTYDDDVLLSLLRDLADSADALDGTGYTLGDLDDLDAAADEVDEVSMPQTDAHYNESPDELADREQRMANRQTLSGQGLAEVVLILTNDKREQFYQWVERLRQRWGPDLTNGEVVYAALARVAEQVDA